MRIFEKFNLNIFNKNLGSSQRYTAFTLAEVLITLGIIGVVAAMTIPALITNYQKQQYVTQLKKAYTTFNQALVKIAADNGCTGDLACTGLFDVLYDSEGNEVPWTAEDSGEKFVQYFNVLKKCKYPDESCWPSEVSFNYDGSDGKIAVGHSETNYSFLTTDGMAFLLDIAATSCAETIPGAIYMSKWCSDVTIDVNGLKGPNTYGRDIFRYYIANGRGPILYPMGGKELSSVSMWWKSNSPNRCTSNNPDGMLCTGRIMEESWEMNY